jgi:hypothetical protein
MARLMTFCRLQRKPSSTESRRFARKDVPLTGALVAIDELWIASALYSSPLDAHWIHVLLAVLPAGVATRGAGAWSIGARLFGRKWFDIGKSN